MVSKYTKDGIQAIYGLEDVKHLGHTLASYLLQKGFIVKHILSSYTAIERAKHPIIDKYRDSIANIDDALGVLILAKVPIAEKLHVDKTLPAIYSWCGYRAGISN